MSVSTQTWAKRTGVTEISRNKLPPRSSRAAWRVVLKWSDHGQMHLPPKAQSLLEAVSTAGRCWGAWGAVSLCHTCCPENGCHSSSVPLAPRQLLAPSTATG